MILIFSGMLSKSFSVRNLGGFLLNALIFAILVSSLSRAAHATPQPTSTPSPPLKMIFGVYRPPYIFEKKNMGLDFEITQAVVEVMGRQLTSIHSTNKRGWTEIESGKADAMVGVKSEDAQGPLHFSEPILIYDNVAISKESKKIALEHVADLKKVRYLSFSEAGRYLGPEYKKLAGSSQRATEISDQRKQNLLFWSDKIDVIILDLNVFRYYQREFRSSFNTKDPVVIHRLFSMKSNWRTVAFRDKALRDQFNVALATIRSSGRYQAILDKYLNVNVIEPTTPKP